MREDVNNICIYSFIHKGIRELETSGVVVSVRFIDGIVIDRHAYTLVCNFIVFSM